MPDVNVSSDILKKQITELNTAGNEIERTRKAILSQYQRLGSQWNDEKYRALGDIVNESNSSLRSIEKIFLQSQKALLQILNVVLEYEATDIAGSGGTSSEDGGYSRHLSAEEVNARWQAGVESINEQIANYKEALMAKGVPDCKWLNDTLAKYKAAMLEQEGHDLDVASGHGEDSIHNGEAYLYPDDYGAFYDQLADQFNQYCLSGANPNFHDAPEWRNNCQRCVPAYESRRRGNETTARPSTYGSSHLSYRPFDVWQGAEVINCQGSGMRDIQSAMSAWGDGSRAQVVIYKDTPLGGGHTFIAEQRNGTTYFIDPQTGASDVSYYFNLVIPNSTQFCRIDNLEFSSYAEECYTEASND